MDCNLNHCKFVPMTIEEASRFIMSSLSGLYDEREASAISSMIMEELTQMPKSVRLLHKKELFTEEQENRFRLLHDQLLQQRPVQYVLGKAWFGSLSFAVSEDVLIPRPETEELVDWLIKENPGTRDGLSVLDIGTGSGCIAITIKQKCPAHIVSGLDISKEALEIAAFNARQNQTEIIFYRLDILDKNSWTKIPQMDIIASNPPYIPEKEKKQLDKHVRDFEPGLALFVPDADPIVFYKTIGNFAIQRLNPDGCLYLEIHHDYAVAISDWYLKNGFSVELRKDFSGNNRMIKARRN